MDLIHRIHENFSASIELKKSSMESLAPLISSASKIMVQCIKNGNKILSCGNKTCSQILAQSSKSVREKIEKTCINKYGLKTNLLLSGNKEKSAMAIINKYGSYKNLYIYNSKKYKEKTGYDNSMKNPDIIKKTQENRIRTILSFSPERKILWYERRLQTMIKNGAKLFGGKRPDSSKRKYWNYKKTGFNISKQQIDFFTKLSKYAENIYFGDNEKRIWINDKKYYIVDGFIENKNIVIEYNGDYWHCNPDIYLPEDIITIRGERISAKSIWDYDSKRKNDIIEKLQCKYIVVWENDFIKNEHETIRSILEEINE